MKTIVVKSERNRPLGRLRIILTCILKKRDVSVWTGVSGSGQGAVVGCSEYGDEHYSDYKSP
jgi:hypothetical protein